MDSKGNAQQSHIDELCLIPHTFWKILVSIPLQTQYAAETAFITLKEEKPQRKASSTSWIAVKITMQFWWILGRLFSLNKALVIFQQPPAHLVWQSDLLLFPLPESQAGQDKNSQVWQRQRLPPEQAQRTPQRTAGADGEKTSDALWHRNRKKEKAFSDVFIKTDVLCQQIVFPFYTLILLFLVKQPSANYFSPLQLNRLEATASHMNYKHIHKQNTNNYCHS